MTQKDEAELPAGASVENGELLLQNGNVRFAPMAGGGVRMVTLGSFDPVFTPDEVALIAEWVDDVMVAALAAEDGEG